MIYAKKNVDVDKVVAVRGMRSGQIRGTSGQGGSSQGHEKWPDSGYIGVAEPS